MTNTELRRYVYGASLIAAPVLALVSSLVDAEQGTDTPPAELYSIAAAQGDAIGVAALLFIASSVLLVPAIAGMLLLVYTRGAALTFAGATLATVGAFGHMAYGTYQLLLTHVPADDGREALVGYLDRSAAVWSVVLPMLLAFPIGLLLMMFGLRRARAVPLWVPLIAVTAIVAQTVLESTPAAETSDLVVWTLASLGLGRVGLEVIRPSRNEPEVPSSEAHMSASRGVATTT